MTRDPAVVIIALFLWLMLIIVSVIFEENYAKRIPAHKLRFPRCLGAVGIGFPFACGWMVWEMLRASDWETAKLFYLLLGIPAFLLLGLGGVWMTLHSLNWGIDIKEDRMVYRTALRRTRTIFFTEITGIEHRSPRIIAKGVSRRGRPLGQLGAKRRAELQKGAGSYCIRVGKGSIKVYALAYHYDGSAARILKAMKKQGITCPVTTKKTWFS
jgi:hypothetical protein